MASDGPEQKKPRQSMGENTLPIMEAARADLATKPYRVFIADTETSGFMGVYPAHPRHIMLQICCIDILTGAVFKSYCSHGNMYKIPPAATKYNGIEDSMIAEEGEHVDIIMRKFLQWVNAQCQWDETEKKYGKTPIMVAHNADFDKEVIRKHFPVPTGRRGELMQWAWYDTLTAFRELYPDILNNKYKPEYQVMPFKDQPYKLQSLIKHFFPQVDGRFHDAEFDCKCLMRLFVEHLYGPKMEFPIWPPYDLQTGKIIYDGGADPMYARGIPMLAYVKDLKYMWKYITVMTTKLNYEFGKAGDEWKRYITNEAMLTFAHLFYYGWMKTSSAIKTCELTGTPMPCKDLWWNILMHVECFLREKVDMYSDENILDFFRHITNSSGVDVVKHMKREDTLEPMFPTMPGHPISYRPFNFSNADAQILYQEFGFRSAHDMYIDFASFGGERHREWFYRIVSKLGVHSRSALSIEECTRCFTEIIPRLRQVLSAQDPISPQ